MPWMITWGTPMRNTQIPWLDYYNPQSSTNKVFEHCTNMLNPHIFVVKSLPENIIFVPKRPARSRWPPRKCPFGLQGRARKRETSRCSARWCPQTLYIYIYTYIHKYICMYVCMYVLENHNISLTWNVPLGDDWSALKKGKQEKPTNPNADHVM